MSGGVTLGLVVGGASYAAGAAVGTALLVGAGAAAVGEVTGANDWVADNVTDPVLDFAGDFVDGLMEDPLATVAKVALIATGNTWAIPLVDGAQVAVNGGDIGDVFKAVAVSYVAQTVGAEVGDYASEAISESVGNAVVADVLTEGVKGTVNSIIYGKDPLEGFITGAAGSALDKGMGYLSEKTGIKLTTDDAEVTGTAPEFDFEVPPIVADTIKGTLANALAGQDPQMAFGNALASSVITLDAVKNVLADGDIELNNTQLGVLTQSIQAVAGTAVGGGSGAEAAARVQAILSGTGAKALADKIQNSDIGQAIADEIDKFSGDYDEVQGYLDEIEKIEALRDGQINRYNKKVAPLLEEQEWLRKEYDKLVGSDGYVKDGVTQEQIDNFESRLADYNEAKDDFEFWEADQKVTLKISQYEKRLNSLGTQLEDAQEKLQENSSLAQAVDDYFIEARDFFTAEVTEELDPNFNVTQYKKLNGLTGLTDEAAYNHYLETGQFEGLITNNKNFAELKTTAIDTLLNSAAKEAGFSLTELSKADLKDLYTAANGKFTTVDSVLNGASLVEEFTEYALDARENSKGALSTTLIKVGDLNKNYVTTYNSDGSISLLSEADYADKINKEFAGTWDPYTGNTKGNLIDIVNGDAQIKFNSEQEPLTILITGGQSANVGNVINQLGEDTAIEMGFTEQAIEYTQRMLQAAGKSATDLASSIGTVVGDLTGIEDSEDAVKFVEEMLRSSDPDSAFHDFLTSGVAGLGETFKALSTTIGDVTGFDTSGAEKFFGDLVAVADANSSNELKTAVANFQKRMDDAEGWGVVGAVWENFKDAPTEFLTHYVAREIVPEVVPWLVGGGAAKAASSVAKAMGKSDDVAKAIGIKFGLTGAAITDAAEAYGGEVEGYYNDAYATAIKAGMSEQEASAYAHDVSVKGASMAAMLSVVSSVTGGEALTDVLIGKGMTEKGVQAVIELSKVMTKEGVSEGLEEGLSQAYVEGMLYQLDPTRDVTKNIVQNATLGAIAGSGVSGGVYTGVKLVDTVGSQFKNTDALTTKILAASIVASPQVQEVMANPNYTPAQVVKELKALGVDDSLTYTEILSTKFPDQYNSIDTVADEFGKYAYYTPTADDITLAMESGNGFATQVANSVDIKYYDADEVKEFFAAQGFTDPTEEDIQQFVGQYNTFADRTAAQKEADTFADSRNVTYEEAKQMFSDLGYTASREEILKFVGSQNPTGADEAQTTEQNIKSAVGAYVDPRYTDFAEAKQWLVDNGYTPTNEEVQKFVGQIKESQQQTAIAEWADPRVVTEDEVTAAYEALGLSRPTQDDIQALMGQYMESELAGKAEDYLPTARYNSIVSILDEMAGNSGVTPEMQEALDIVKGDMINALGDLGLEVAAIDQTVNSLEDAVGNIASGQEEATGLYGYIDQAVKDLKDAGLTNEQVQETIEGVVGTPATDDAEATGIYAELEGMSGELEDTKNDILDVLGNPATDDTEATGLYNYIDSAVDNLGLTLADLQGNVGTPAEYDADGNLVTEPTGIYAELSSLEAAGLTRDEAIAQLAIDLGVAVTDLTDAISTTEETLSGEIGEVASDVGNIQELLGKPAVTDNPFTEEDESADPTGLFGIIDQYETAGQERDEAISSAISDLSTQLGVTEENLIAELGLTETNIRNDIDLLETSLTEQLSTTEANITEDIADLADQLGTTEENLTTQITDLSTQLGTTEENLINQIKTGDENVITQLSDALAATESQLSSEIDIVADLVGKPASEITQTDYDFYVDLLAQEEALTEQQVQQYDVTGDNLVDDQDLALLQQGMQGQPITFAPTSQYAPTGVYAQMEQNQQATTDLITEMERNINANINVAREEADKRSFMEQVLASGDAQGQRVDVRTPDPLQLNYIYDWSSIFANPSQESLFVSPYAEGGKVDNYDEDELFKLLGGS
jgi:hypothetical protein